MIFLILMKIKKLTINEKGKSPYNGTYIFWNDGSENSPKKKKKIWCNK